MNSLNTSNLKVAILLYELNNDNKYQQFVPDSRRKPVQLDIHNVWEYTFAWVAKATHTADQDGRQMVSKYDWLLRQARQVRGGGLYCETKGVIPQYLS